MLISLPISDLKYNRFERVLNHMPKHVILNNKIKLTSEHFGQWFFWWRAAIDDCLVVIS